jgi:hypothetical protein
MRQDYTANATMTLLGVISSQRQSILSLLRPM